jgi:hypothetical protein
VLLENLSKLDRDDRVRDWCLPETRSGGFL